MEATADAATPLNLAQHTYFNLNGQANGTVLDHVLELNACAALHARNLPLAQPGDALCKRPLHLEYSILSDLHALLPLLLTCGQDTWEILDTMVM